MRTARTGPERPRRVRGTIWLGATAVLAAAFALAGCKKEIYHGLSELEANEIVVVLSEHGIPAEKLPDAAESKKGAAYLISVDEVYATDAKRVLLDEQMPRPREKGFADLFAAPSMIPTETEEKARFLTACQGELAATLEDADGVVDAKVHLVLPEANPLEAGRELTEARAAVLIKYRGRIGELKEEERTRRENEVYRAMLVSLAQDLGRLRSPLLRDLSGYGTDEKRSLVALDTYFTEKRGDDPDAKEARAHFQRLKEVSLKRDGTIRQIEALPKVKDLEQTLAKVRDLELESLPFSSAQVRALVARATPRLSEDDVTVEFTKVQPKPVKERVTTPGGPPWLTVTNFLVLAATTAVLALGLIGLAVYIMNLKKQIAQVRKAAAKAASASLSTSVAPPAS